MKPYIVHNDETMETFDCNACKAQERQKIIEKIEKSLQDTFDFCAIDHCKFEDENCEAVADNNCRWWQSLKKQLLEGK